MSIYLEEYKNIKPNSIIELIQTWYAYSTPYGQIKSIETFSDIDCTIHECDKNKFRSVDALIELALTYFPEATIKEIINALINTDVIVDNKRGYLYLFYCQVICRPVFYFNDVLLKSPLSESIDEDYFDDDDQSKYENWKEVLNIIDMTEDQLYKHLKEKLI